MLGGCRRRLARRGNDALMPGDELSELIPGAAGSQTLLRAVGPAVNDARYDGPDCLEPPREEQQGALF